jgi:hypothetical protein
MYNVLEKLRAGEPLTTKEQTIHEQGLVSVLRQIHDDLDAAVADAYGWPVDLSDEEILARLVALNHERADEERRGIIRYLRPDFQNPTGQRSVPLPLREGLGEGSVAAKPAKPPKQTWPKTLSEQAGAVHAALSALSTGASAEEVSKSFGRKNDKRTERIEEILETLATLGKARELDNERFIAM